MLNVKLICVGKMKEKFYIGAAEEYIKRLGAYCKLEIDELPESKLPQDPNDAQITAALQKEAQLIEAKIPKGAWVCAMCVEGDMLSSEQLAERIGRLAVEGSGKLCFIIGGSVGLHDSIKALADMKLSMSRMTFPHHLARVVLLEQIYRAFKINEGSRYHK